MALPGGRGRVSESPHGQNRTNVNFQMLTGIVCLVSITQTGRWTSNRKSAREQLAPGSGDSETG